MPALAACLAHHCLTLTECCGGCFVAGSGSATFCFRPRRHEHRAIFRQRDPGPQQGAVKLLRGGNGPLNKWDRTEFVFGFPAQAHTSCPMAVLGMKTDSQCHYDFITHDQRGCCGPGARRSQVLPAVVLVRAEPRARKTRQVSSALSLAYGAASWRTGMEGEHVQNKDEAVCQMSRGRIFKGLQGPCPSFSLMKAEYYPGMCARAW